MFRALLSITNSFHLIFFKYLATFFALVLRFKIIFVTKTSSIDKCFANTIFSVEIPFFKISSTFSSFGFVITIMIKIKCRKIVWRYQVIRVMMFMIGFTWKHLCKSKMEKKNQNYVKDRLLHHDCIKKYFYLFSQFSGLANWAETTANNWDRLWE